MPPGQPPARHPSNGDFDALLAAARENRPEAWERLYRWLAPGVAGYLRMQGAHEADDLTSDVFLAVFRRLGDFAGSEPSFRSWVFTVAHSRLVDERRRWARRPATVPLDTAPEVFTREANPADAALQSLELAEIEAVCGRLPAEQRSVLLLRVIGDLSIDQVAQILGKSPGAIKQLQRRGFEAVRNLLAREGVTL